jgi:hypothetical protein
MHTSGRAQLRHPVRPVMEPRSRLASRGGYVDPELGYKVPIGLPPHGPTIGIPLPSPGPPRYRFPCFIGTMRMCDSRRPSHRASFPSLGDTRRRACRFAPGGPERTTAGRGLLIRSPLPEKAPGDDPGLPSSWGTLVCLRPALRPRRDRRYRDKAIAVDRRGPTHIVPRGLSTRGNFGARSHGISTRCLRFAVRISPPHARLASGCGPGSTRRDWLPAGFLRKVSVMLLTSLPPFPSFLAQWMSRFPVPALC